MSSLKRSRPLDAQMREIIWKVHQFMKKEAEEAETQIFTKERFKKVIERTSQASGVSVRTIQRIIAEKRTSTSDDFSYKKPKKKWKKVFRLKLDEYKYNEIRKTLNNLQFVDKEWVSAGIISNTLSTNNIITGSRGSLRRILKDLGFMYTEKKTLQRQLCVENDEVRSLRKEYIRLINKYRNEGRNVVYGIETTYVHSVNEMSEILEEHGIKSKPQELIILNAGGEKGFVPNALLMYELKYPSNSGEIKKKKYIEWLKEKLIPNLEPNSVFVIDKNFMPILEAPASDCPIEMLQEWLMYKYIHFEQNASSIELHNIIKNYIQQNEKYSIDLTMEAHGHKILRIPLYHPDLCPIKHIWSQILSHMEKNVTNVDLFVVMDLLTEEFSAIGEEVWVKLIEQSIQCENEYLNLEKAIEERLCEWMAMSQRNDSLDPEPSCSSDDESEDNDGNAMPEIVYVKCEEQ